MKKIKLFLIINLTILILPLGSFAQFDFNLGDLFSETISNELETIINNIEIIWSADTYTPYEYRGRNLPSIGSKITIEVIVSISQGNLGNLQYSWFVENVFQSSKSGYGKNSMYFYAKRFPFQTIKIQIFNEERTVFEERTIRIPIVSPEIIVYSPLQKTQFPYHANKIHGITTGEKTSFIAKPYFFSVNQLTDLSFEWNFPNEETIESSDYGANVFEVIISKNENPNIIKTSLWINVINKLNSKQKTYQSINIQIN